MIRAHRKTKVECAATAGKYQFGYQEGYICGFLEGTVLKNRRVPILLICPLGNILKEIRVIFRLHPATPPSGTLGSQKGLVVSYIEASVISHSRPPPN